MEITNETAVNIMQGILPDLNLNDPKTMNGLFAMQPGANGQSEPTPLAEIQAKNPAQFAQTFNRLVNDGNLMVARQDKIRIIHPTAQGGLDFAAISDYRKKYCPDLTNPPPKPGRFKRFFSGIFKNQINAFDRYMRRVDSIIKMITPNAVLKAHRKEEVKDLYESAGVPLLMRQKGSGVPRLAGILLRGLGEEWNHQGPLRQKLIDSEAFQNILKGSSGTVEDLVKNATLFDRFNEELQKTPDTLGLTAAQKVSLNKHCLNPQFTDPTEIYANHMIAATRSADPSLINVDRSLSPEAQKTQRVAALALQHQTNALKKQGAIPELHVLRQQLSSGQNVSALSAVLQRAMGVDPTKPNPLAGQMMDCPAFLDLIGMGKSNLQNSVSSNNLLNTFADKLMNDPQKQLPALTTEHLNSLFQHCTKPPVKLVEQIDQHVKQAGNAPQAKSMVNSAVNKPPEKKAPAPGK